MKRVSVVFLLSIFIFTKFSCVSGNMVSDMVKVYGELGKNKSSIYVGPSQECFYDRRLMDALIRHVNSLVREGMGMIERHDCRVFVSCGKRSISSDALERLTTEIVGVRRVDCETIVFGNDFYDQIGFTLKISPQDDGKVRFKIIPNFYSSKYYKGKEPYLKKFNSCIRWCMDLFSSWSIVAAGQYEVWLECYGFERYFWPRSFKELIDGIKNLKGISLNQFSSRKNQWFIKRVLKYFPKDLEYLGITGYQLTDKFLRSLKMPQLSWLHLYGNPKLSNKGVDYLAKNCPKIECLRIINNHPTVRDANFSEMKNLKELYLSYAKEEDEGESWRLEQENKFLDQLVNSQKDKQVFFLRNW